VIDVAGGNSIKSSIKSTRVGGRVHMVGYAAGTSTDIDIFEAIRHAVTINVGMAGHRASFEAMIRAIEVNRICSTRGAIYKASEFRLALARLAQGGHLGKIVLELGDGL
jgi:D-arabinose 1-dehydrogenase-like Zn-dependent alcohol dehydrogenase